MDKTMHRPELLVLVRHGESQRNVAKKDNRYFPDDEARRYVKGIPDHKIALTENGKRQAVETGRALRERFGAFDYVYHSGYQRTIETCEGILQGYAEEERAKIKVRHNLFIRERDSGHAYDMTTAEAEAAFPWMAEYWQTVGSFFAYPPGGESQAQVCQRVYLFLNMLFRERGGQKVLTVIHGGTLRAFRYLLERLNYDEVTDLFRAEAAGNCSVTTYRYNPK